MWVEIKINQTWKETELSSSSWGCELKCVHRYQAAHAFRHPLREDVSWNTCVNMALSKDGRHPLREDVSWNITYAVSPVAEVVILFVRMWVEIFWQGVGSKRTAVILFVRMWVEIRSACRHPLQESSSSSWGCELKWYMASEFLRLILSSSSWGCELKWILLSKKFITRLSSSSWGCELK